MKNRVFILVLLLIPKLTLNQRLRIYQKMDWAQKCTWEQWIEMLEKILGDLKFLENLEVQNLKLLFAEQLSYIQSFDYLCLLDDYYPAGFRLLSQPPIVLFYRGNLELLHTPCLAVVGARKNSRYGQYLLNQWIPAFNQAGLTIVSGLASGIDAIAHINTLRNNGRTVGILGTGLNRVYPLKHAALQKAVSVHGLVISEYLPNQGPKRVHFPQRNRLIAALSHCVLVVEARRRSGSLITADLALDLNRGVLVVPGRVDFELSRGCNGLLTEGAAPVLSAVDVITAFNDYYWLN